MPSFHKQERIILSELGLSVPDSHLNNSTDVESGRCLLAKDTLLSDGTLAPIGVCSKNPPQHFSHLGFSYAYGDTSPRLPNIALALLVCMVFLLLETHSKSVPLCAEALFGLKILSLTSS